MAKRCMVCGENRYAFIGVNMDALSYHSHIIVYLSNKVINEELKMNLISLEIFFMKIINYE